MASRVIQGDVFTVLPTIERGSIDCAVTSPPYWKLRSYLPKDHPLKPLELGSEATPAKYVANMVRVFGLVRECLADHGTLWVNIGDSYAQTTTRHRRHLYEPGDDPRGKGGFGSGHQGADELIDNGQSTAVGIDAGNLCLIPQRLAISLQDDGWLVRSVVVWHKPSAMPASLSGWMWRRCRVKVKGGGAPARTDKEHQGRYGTLPQRDGGYCLGAEMAQWADCPGCKKCSPHGGLVLRRGSWRPTSSYEPVLMLAKTDRYYCDGIAVQTPAASATLSRDRYTRVLDDPDEQFAVAHDHETDCGGFANLRDVWTIAAEPLKEKHYAAFPTALVSNCLRAGTSSKGYCRSCGAPWCRVVDSKEIQYCPNSASNRGHSEYDREASLGQPQRGAMGVERTTLGWRPSCSCDAGESRPGRVLDCFAGSGRTGLEAQRLGLDFVGVELNPSYAEMSNRLLREDMPLFFAPDVPAAVQEDDRG